MRALLRFWFAFENDVDRRAYLLHGLGLMAVKYAVDASIIGLTTDVVWAPWDYLNPVPLISAGLTESGPAWLAPTLLAWTMPFLWIGVTLTMRRLLNAGWSPWYSLLFFVPFIGYGLMAVLVVVPEARESRAVVVVPQPNAERRPAAAKAIMAGVAVGLAMILLSILWLERYGLATFMGTPFAIGVVAGYVFCRGYSAKWGETAGVVLLAALLTTLASFAVGVEGAVCILMMAPLGIPLVLMGGAVGRAIAQNGGRSLEGVLVLAMLPTSAALEDPADVYPLREVTSVIEIEASPDEVWDAVVAFPELPPPEELLFRLGVAYPISAHIDGGVRYCVFSTGAFVEPITHSEPGRRLAFDVVESPRPLDELSPYSIKPPHLDGYLVPRRGEFRIVSLGGSRARLEGTTWYEQRLRPGGYWGLFSDKIIAAIHHRVLAHIRDVAEARASVSPARVPGSDPAETESRRRSSTP